MAVQISRRAVWIAVGAVIIAGLIYGYWPRASVIEAATVRRAPFQVTVEEEGQTRVIDRFVVSAPVAGFARRISLDIGDRVIKGQALVKLEAPRSQVLDPRTRAEAQARVAAAQAALQSAEQQASAAKSEADYARVEYDRIRNLAQRHLVSKDQEDQAHTRLLRSTAAERSAAFTVQVSQHELDAARTALRYANPQASTAAEPIDIDSPVNGSVLRLYRESEGTVGAGQPLIEIGDSSALEAVVDVLSADAVRIRPGMRVVFQRWGGGADLQGRVRRVEPVGFTKVSALGVEEQRVNIISDFVSPTEEWSHLGDGYRVEAKFILWEGEQVLQIPSSALFREGEQWAVFKIVERHARRQIVKVGQRNGLLAQIMEGLSEGDQVITHPDESIQEGAPVEVSKR